MEENINDIRNLKLQFCLWAGICRSKTLRGEGHQPLDRRADGGIAECLHREQDKGSEVT